MVEIILIVAFVVAGVVAFGVEQRSKKRWETPEIELLRAKVQYDEMRKDK
jgi:hypothetical protein